MYIKVSNETKAQEIVKALEELGFVNSIYSGAGVANCKGIAVYFNPADNTRNYILLNNVMMCSDPRISWIANRQEMESPESLLRTLKEWLARSL